jgi:translation initiation factor 6 (eIF-6)
MIERKLRNHATRKYPKDFNANELSNLYEETFEEKYDNKGNLIMAEERVQIASGEFDDKAGTEIIEETTPNDDRPTIENVDEETGEVNVTESEETEQLIEPNVEENDDMPFSGNKKENVESKLIKEQPLERMDRGENKDDDDSDPDWDE